MSRGDNISKMNMMNSLHVQREYSIHCIMEFSWIYLISAFKALRYIVVQHIVSVIFGKGREFSC